MHVTVMYCTYAPNTRGKLESKSAQGRPRRMWLDDIKNWTNPDSHEAIKRTAEMEILNLLKQERTDDDDDDDDYDGVCN